MYKNEGSTGAMLMALYAFATTAADCRIWTMLPSDFQLLRIKKPASGVLKITPASGGGQGSRSLEIPAKGNTIVYIRMIGPDVEPVYEIITF